MKKVFFVLVLAMSVMGLNAQTTKTTTKSEKSSHSATINVADLPKSVTDNVAKDYPGFTIKEAKSKTGKSGLDYVVSISKGTDNETIIYYKNGKFVKKETPKTAMHHETKKK